MNQGTTAPGRYQLQLLVNAPTTNAHGFGAQAFNGRVGQWASGTSDVLANTVALASGASSPNPLTERRYADRNQRTLVTSTIVLDLRNPTSNATLAVMFAKALADAGIGLQYGALSTAFMGGALPAGVTSARLTIAPWSAPRARPAAPAPPRPPAPSPGTPAGAAPPQPAPAPSPLPPTPPVPLTVAERAATGPIAESDDPARVGVTQSVFAPDTLADAVRVGDWWVIAGVTVLVILIAGAVYTAVSGGDRK